MTNFIHRASGLLPSGASWSVGLKSTGAITEAAAETAWGNAFAAFWGDATVKTYYSTVSHFTLSSTSTASSTWKQQTKTSTGAGTGTSTASTTRHPARRKRRWCWRSTRWSAARLMSARPSDLRSSGQ